MARDRGVAWEEACEESPVAIERFHGHHMATCMLITRSAKKVKTNSSEKTGIGRQVQSQVKGKNVQHAAVEEVCNDGCLICFGCNSMGQCAVHKRLVSPFYAWLLASTESRCDSNWIWQTFSSRSVGLQARRFFGKRIAWQGTECYESIGKAAAQHSGPKADNASSVS